MNIRLLAVLTAVLGVLRVYAATRVGFGDSEALYACYALHPQPAYLDHPGLIGLLARAIGGSGAPTPLQAHAVTSVAATAAPWIAVVCARALGAKAGAEPGVTWERAAGAGVVIALVPETCVGLFALTPDLPLYFTWLGAVALAALGLRAEPSSLRAAVSLLATGVLAGVAMASKVTGLTLWIALAIAYASRPARAHARTIWPWAGLAAGALAILPIVGWELDRGWPMIRHRLVETQSGAGLSLRNLGAVVGGQLLYVSPLLAIALVAVARHLWRERARDATRVLLFSTFAAPLAILLPLVLWSRVAEPHWLAPPLLALLLHAFTSSAPVTGVLSSARFRRAAVAVAGVLSLAAHAWVLVPAAARLVPKEHAHLDITSELYGWPDAIASVREVIAQEGPPSEVAVVGPHWIVCAQLHAALGADARVGCLTPIRDDFDGWTPRDSLRDAVSLVYVTDARFDLDVAAAFPKRAVLETRRIVVTRGGRVVREFRISVLGRAQTAKANLVEGSEGSVSTAKAPSPGARPLRGASCPRPAPGWAS
jgi:hypothetical protein